MSHHDLYTVTMPIKHSTTFPSETNNTNFDLKNKVLVVKSKLMHFTPLKIVIIIIIIMAMMMMMMMT